MDDPFTFLWSQRCDTKGVQTWLPIVERSFGTEGYDNVLIQHSRIIRERFDISGPGEHFPGWRPDKLLPRSRCQRRGELATRRDTGLGCYEIGEKQSMCLYAIHNFLSSLKIGEAQSGT
jgi:hypothetical protein